MASDISKKTVMILLLVAIVLSAVMTYRVTTTKQEVKVVQPTKSTSSGEVRLTIGGEENKVNEATGNIMLEIK